jgi:hypothetical protein
VVIVPEKLGTTISDFEGDGSRQKTVADHRSVVGHDLAA